MITNTREMDGRTQFYLQDGLVDIFVGLGVLMAGLYIWADMPWMAGIFIPVFLPAFKSAQERFVRGRVGAPVYDRRLQSQGQKVMGYIALLLVVFLVAGTGLVFAYGVMDGTALEWLRVTFLLVLGGVFASLWVLAAIMLKANRFYFYALFTFLPLALAQYTALPFWAALTITGGLILLTGFGVFLSFLQAHPVQK